MGPTFPLIFYGRHHCKWEAGDEDGALLCR